MKTPLSFPILICILIILSMSTVSMTVPGGVAGVEAVDPFLTSITPNSTGANATPPHFPMILSRGPDAILSFYAVPSHTPQVLYDQWDIILFGTPGEPFLLKINNVTTSTGNLSRYYVNVSYDASRIDRATVYAHVGNISYSWAILIVKHKQIGYTPSELSISGNKYGISDLRLAQLKGAAGVLIMSLLMIPAVWWAVKEWRHRQGVRQW